MWGLRDRRMDKTEQPGKAVLAGRHFSREWKASRGEEKGMSEGKGLEGRAQLVQRH